MIDMELPHYHRCLFDDHAKIHLNQYPCFDLDDVPEAQHRGYNEICWRCDIEVARWQDDGGDGY